MATTDNIGHTPCRTSTPPFGHSALPFTDARTKGRRRRRVAALDREPDGGWPCRKRFPLGTLPPAMGGYLPKPNINVAHLCVVLVSLLVSLLFFFLFLLSLSFFAGVPNTPFFSLSISIGAIGRSIGGPFLRSPVALLTVCPAACGSLSCPFSHYPFSEKADPSSLNGL